VEESDDQINDEVVVDAAFEDLSVTTASESEMSSNDQVVSMDAGETNNAVIQFVGDNIDFNMSLFMGTLPLNGLDQSHLASATFARYTHNNSCPQGEVEGNRQC